MSETITRNNPTNLLLAPGPVPIPAFVAQSLAKPVIHHRGPAFAAVMQALRAGLQHLLQTQGATGLMIGSGTFGIETGMYSLFRPGERVLIVDNGKFSERWGEYGEVIGLENVLLKKNWGEVPSPEEVVAAATEGKPVSGVVITHCETSTGALTDLESVAVALRQALPDVLILVDAITSAGAVPFYLDDWDIDAAVVASQKALMNPAGIICWGLSERAVARLRPTRPGDFANWFNYHEAAKKDSFPFTPPIQGIYGILAALDHIREDAETSEFYDLLLLLLPLIPEKAFGLFKTRTLH